MARAGGRPGDRMESFLVVEREWEVVDGSPECIIVQYFYRYIP